MKIDTMNKNYQTKYDWNKERKKDLGKLCWPNTGRGEAHIPGALHCRSSTCLKSSQSKKILIEK